MAITFKSNQVFGCICLACAPKAQLFGTCWERLALRSLVGLSLVGMVSSVWFLLCSKETITGNCWIKELCIITCGRFFLQTDPRMSQPSSSRESHRHPRVRHPKGDECELQIARDNRLDHIWETGKLRLISLLSTVFLYHLFYKFIQDLSR